MVEYAQFVDTARTAMENLGVLEELEDVSDDGVYRTVSGDRLSHLGLPYTVDREDVVAIFRSDYIPGFSGSGPGRTFEILRSAVHPKDFGDFFLLLACQDDVAHVVSFTSSVPSPRSGPTSPHLRFALRLPQSRVPEFLSTFGEAVWRPHSKRALRLAGQIESLVQRFKENRHPRVEIQSITPELLRLLQRSPEELAKLSPDTFEALVAERLQAMGLGVRSVGRTNRKDGGVDIIAWPERVASIPFLLAIQVKHSAVGHKVGPGPVRDLRGVLSNLPFHAGMLVTNTGFTPNAQCFAAQQAALLRLRDMQDIMRWVRGDFLGELSWREIPTEIELAPGIVVEIPKWYFWSEASGSGTAPSAIGD